MAVGVNFAYFLFFSLATNLIIDNVGTSLVFGGFAACCLVGAIFFIIKLEDTADLTKEQL